MLLLYSFSSLLTSSGSAGEPDELAASRKARGRSAPHTAARTRASPRQAAARVKHLIVAVPSTVMRCSTPGKVVVVAADERGPLSGLELMRRNLESPGFVAVLALVLDREEQAEPPRLSLAVDRRHEPLRQIACRSRRA